MNILYHSLEAFFIVAALSIDSFIAGFAYGTNKIKIPFASVMVVGAICTFAFATSIFLGNILRPYIPSAITTAICFLILAGLGVSKIFDGVIKALIRRHRGFSKKIRFSAFNLGFILDVYANPEEADLDQSKLLSPVEAAYLAIALSLDSIAVGFGAGIVQMNPVLLITFSLAANLLSIVAGCFFGNKIARHSTKDYSWIGGALLVVMAILRL